jgi:putative NADH-flavin reductase
MDDTPNNSLAASLAKVGELEAVAEYVFNRLEVLSMAVYVVTGGGGFIGSHIVEELLRRGETTKVIDNFSTGKRENVAAFRKDAEIIEADIAEGQESVRAFHRSRLRHSSSSHSLRTQVHT